MLRALLIASLALLWACSVEQGDSGDECMRTTQCGQGLACVEGRCTTNLRAIGARSMVPELRMDAGLAPLDAAADAPAADDAG